MCWVQKKGKKLNFRKNLEAFIQKLFARVWEVLEGYDGTIHSFLYSVLTSKFPVKLWFFNNWRSEINTQNCCFWRKNAHTLRIFQTFFLCKVAFTWTSWPEAWAISTAQGWGDLDVEYELTEIFTFFWLPSVFTKSLRKKQPERFQRKKVQIVKEWHVVVSRKVKQNLSLHRVEQNLNDLESISFGGWIIYTLFFYLLGALNLKICSYFFHPTEFIEMSYLSLNSGTLCLEK